MNTSSDSTYKEKRSHAEQIRLEVKKEWASLWKNKYKDEKNAEGISIKDYHWLSVDQGQVIYASRGCKALEYEDILEKNLGKSYQAKINPHPETGGWRKFAKKEFSRKESKRENRIPSRCQSWNENSCIIRYFYDSFCISILLNY